MKVVLIKMESFESPLKKSTLLHNFLTLSAIILTLVITEAVFRLEKYV